MKDFNEYFKKMEESLSKIDEKVNENLSALYDKIDEYRDKFRDSISSDKKNRTIIIEADETVHTGKKKKSEDKFVEMAPYLDEESLHELVVEFCDSDLETDMEAILPYLSDKDIMLLADKFRDGVKEFKELRLEELFPFVDDESIDGLFMQKLNAGELDESMLPFVSDGCWHKIVVKYCEEEDSNLNIDEIYPFLNDDDLKLLFKTYLKRRKNKKE